MSIGIIAAVAQSPNWGLWAAVAAVIADSIVTIFVGWRLNKTARKEAGKATETVQTALQTELSNAIVNLLPVLVNLLQQQLGGQGGTPRPISFISEQSKSDTDRMGSTGTTNSRD